MMFCENCSKTINGQHKNSKFREENTMKKIITLALALVLALSLAACGGNPPASNTQGGGETSTQTDTPKSTGKWVLVNTETTKAEENDYYTATGSNGNYECTATTDNQGSGTATASINEPPPEIKVGDTISFQISGSYSGDFPFLWACSAALKFTERYFNLDGLNGDYHLVKFGTGGDLENSNSETVVLKAIKEGEAGETATIRIGLSADVSINTTYTYEWRAGN